MNWLLVYWLLSGPSNFAPTGTAMFADEAACRVALKEIASAWDGNGAAPGVCVPQASADPAPVLKAPSGAVAATPAKRAP